MNQLERAGVRWATTVGVPENVGILISQCWREGYGVTETVRRVRRRTGKLLSRNTIQRRFAELADTP